jgi:glycosyltransferase involved in cell wall biosynthesis
MEIKLSICVPTYNRLDKLLDLLDSLKKINHPQVEILVSDDSTNEITKNHFLNNPYTNITYYKNETNLGQFRNCNSCIARAKGVWVQILHDDDAIIPDYIDSVMPHLDNENIALITGKSDVIELKEQKGIPEIHHKKLEKFAIEYGKPQQGIDFKRKILEWGNPIIFSHTIFRRINAINLGGFDSNLKILGDLDFWLKILDTGDILFLDKKFGSYNLHDSNQMTDVLGFTQGWVENMLIYLSILEKTPKIELEKMIFDISKSAVEGSLTKMQLYSTMIRNKNLSAAYCYIRIKNILISKKALIKTTSPFRNIGFYILYLLTYFFPDFSFYLYKSFKNK